MFQNSDLVEHIDHLKKSARRLTGNVSEAEDLVQNTILRALEKKALFHEGSNLPGWMSRMMFNIFVSQYRHKKKFESKYDPEGVLSLRSAGPSQDDFVQAAQVADAMALLPREQKEIIVLVCVYNFKYQDAANLLSIPVGTVRSRLARARKNLRDILDYPASLPMAA